MLHLAFLIITRYIKFFYLAIKKSIATKTVIIEVVKGLSQKEAVNKINSQIKEVENEEIYDCEIHNIQNDPKWIRYLNKCVTNINVLTFKTTQVFDRNNCVYSALTNEVHPYLSLQRKANRIANPDMTIQEKTEFSIEDEKGESSQQTDDVLIEDIKQIIDERRHSPEDELGKSAPMPNNRPKR